jgi:DNA-binding CsgD family transcriptional regulator
VWTFEDFVEQSQRATIVPELKAFFERAMADEGFENHFIGTIVGRSIVDTGWVEFPEGHFENYLAEQWNKIDPILEFSARAKRPFCWDDVASYMQFSPSQIALLDECKRMGVHSIQVVPFQDPSGRCDIVGISRRHAGRPHPARIPVLQAACAQTFCRYADLIGICLTNEGDMVGLTNRELEILKWIKHGKSNTEISEITVLSIKTIEYHVGNILKKLGASNRTAAVIIAIKNNLLPL